LPLTICPATVIGEAKSRRWTRHNRNRQHQGEEDIMDLTVERVDIWAASITDEPGGLAQVLAGLRDAGADLDFVLARRAPDKPGTGVVFVTPLRNDAEIKAAESLGFKVTSKIHSLRIEGDNAPGAGAELTAKLAEGGINLRGLSAAAIGSKYILYIGLDAAEDAEKAVSILQQA